LAAGQVGDKNRFAHGHGGAAFQGRLHTRWIVPRTRVHPGLSEPTTNTLLPTNPKDAIPDATPEVLDLLLDDIAML
jgi:hypothetical protein